MKIMSSHFFQLPATKMGRWSAGIMIAFIVMIMLKMSLFFPLPSMIVMAIGIVTTIFLIISIIWKGERSWLIWLLLVPGFIAIAFTIAEILYPH